LNSAISKLFFADSAFLY